MTLFFTLVMTAIVCILLGCGVPTTPTYIIMVTIAAPALAMLGVPPLVAHFFVFYYGVLADITPPVALAAYAGASMAGADPFKTGNTAFRLGLGQGAGAVRVRLFSNTPPLPCSLDSSSGSDEDERHQRLGQPQTKRRIAGLERIGAGHAGARIGGERDRRVMSARTP